MKPTTSNVLYGIILVLVYHLTHEWTHYRIFQYYECENIMIRLTSVTAQCLDNGVILANSMVDIIGYTVVPFIVLIAYLVGRE